MFGTVPGSLRAETFSIAVYNLENWVADDPESEKSFSKSDESKAAVIAVIAEHKPDLLGVMEIGELDELEDLQRRLKKAGLNFPHTEWHEADDAVRRVALLSRWPIVSRDSVKGIRFNLGGQLHPMARGILDVTVEVRDHFRVRLLGVHFKSKREVPEFDQMEMRANEARTLRRRIEEIFAAAPDTDMLVFGDLNATRDEYAVREVLGASGLRDLDLSDEWGDRWTHYWSTADLYSRIDFLCVSENMRSLWIPEKSGVDRSKFWRTASDHRLIFATFQIPQP